MKISWEREMSLRVANDFQDGHFFFQKTIEER